MKQNKSQINSPETNRSEVVEGYDSIIKGQTPRLYVRKEDCCGCGACHAICPNSAINMFQDEEGFEYPSIITEKCVRCKLCINVCPIKKANERFQSILY